MTIDKFSSQLDFNNILFYSAAQIPRYALDTNCMQESQVTNISPLLGFYFP